MAQSQVPNISVQDLLAAQAQGPGQALANLAPSMEKGAELADVMTRRKLEQQKLTLEMQKQIQEANQAAKEQQLKTDLGKQLIKANTATPVSKAVPQANLGNLGTPVQSPAALGPLQQNQEAPSQDQMTGAALPSLVPQINADKQQNAMSDLAQLDPKEYLKSSMRAQSVLDKNAPATPEQWAVYNTQWHDIATNRKKEAAGETIPDLPTGLTHQALGDMVTKGALSSNTNAVQERADANMGNLDLNKIKSVNSAWKTFDPQLMGKSDPLRADYDRLLSAKRLITTAGTNKGVLTAPQVQTVASEVANLAIAGGNNQRIASDLISKYVPETALMDWQQKLQYLTANPKDSHVQDVMRPLLSEGLRIAVESESNIRDYQKRTAPTLKNVADSLGQDHQFAVGLAGRGLDPDTYEPTRSVLPDFDPKQWLNRINTQKPGDRVPDILNSNSQSGVPNVGGSYNGEKVLKVTRIK